MCGLLGAAGTPRHPFSTQALHRALDLIRHRGPDDEGYLLFDSRTRTATIAGGVDSARELSLVPLSTYAEREFDIVLAHRRLSILDVSAAGHQPMASKDKRYWIVLNGEIYNFVELRDELRTRGHTFRTGTDTEVVLGAYAEWGVGMFVRFVGMFAMAILDTVERSVLLARDPFGIKPLYWTAVGQTVLFASEIAPLLSLTGARPVADVDALYQYLRFGVTDGHEATLFAGIRQFPAAHFAVLRADGARAVQPEAYWTPGEVRRRKLAFGDAAQELRRLLDDSVRLHLRSDVPLGTCLSGGLDSSAIVASMRAQLGAEAPINSFSFESGNARTGEGPYVELVANTFSLRRHSVSPQASELVADLDTLIRLQEQPFDSTSIYAQYRVFRLAHEAGITVMLDGQGADELFGGYATALSAQLASAIVRGDLFSARALARSSHMPTRSARRHILLSAGGRLLPAALVKPFMFLVGESLYPAWLNRAWFRARGHHAERRPQGRGRDGLRDELLHFVRTLSLPRLLRYEDRNSMAFSIESRVPFCTTALADFAFSLPSSHLVSSAGETKSVLRRAVANAVPREIITRPKVGFETPEHSWLRAMQPWINDVLNSEGFRSLPFVEHSIIDGVIADQLSGRSSFRPVTWRMINIANWARQFDVTFGAP